MQSQTWDTNSFIHTPVKFTELEDLTLPDRRLYRTPNGNVYPSVTSQLGALGKAGIEAWRRRVGEEEANKIIVRASKRGTRIHNLLERYINLDPYYLKGAMPSDVYLFKQVQKVLDIHVQEVYANEFCLYSDIMKCAGRCDLFASYDGQTSIIDFKTSRTTKKEEYILNYKLQATCYALMIKELKGIDVEDFHIIITSDEDEQAQIFSGKIKDYDQQCVDFFTNQYKIQSENQEILQEAFSKGM